jgi:hypothetical protein
MSDYDSLTRAYPPPQLDREPYHPRQSFDIPPSQRFNQNRTIPGFNPDSNVPRFRSFDDDDSEMNSMSRNQFPENHTLPHLDKQQTYIAPYQHVMKRGGNSEKMKEIFGENQVYSSMENIEFPAQTRAPPEQFKPAASSSYNGYIPRMKVLEGPEMKMPIREGFSSAQHSSRYQQKQSSHERIKVYNAILQYFPGYIMTKTAQHGSFGIYKAIVQCLLCNGIRYAVAIVEENNASIGEKRNLSELAWESFQTRYTEDEKEAARFKIDTFAYGHPEGSSILDDTIRLNRETKDSFKYTCDNLPLEIEILKIKQDETMAESGTVATALETFSCVLSFVE